MGEIVNFIKDMFNMESNSGTPVGLCSFEHTEKAVKKRPVKKVQPKREMRLSELME